jgi:hypothetical protein
VLVSLAKYVAAHLAEDTATFEQNLTNAENVGRPTRFSQQRWESISKFGLPANIEKEVSLIL